MTESIQTKLGAMKNSLPYLLMRRLNEQQKKWTADYRNRVIDEYIKFMMLAATGNAVPSKAVDEVWHLHIQFTLDYQVFCRNHLQTFIHHEPAESSDYVAYNKTMKRYVDLFGDLPPEDIWAYKPTLMERIFGIAPKKKEKRKEPDKRYGRVGIGSGGGSGGSSAFCSSVASSCATSPSSGSDSNSGSSCGSFGGGSSGGGGSGGSSCGGSSCGGSSCGGGGGGD